MSLILRGKAIVVAFQESRLGRLFGRYGEDRADLLAAAVALNALFSMFPISLGVLAIVGMILRNTDAQSRAQALILSTVPAEGAASVVQALGIATQNPGLFGLLSLAGLFWGGSNLFGTLEIAFDLVYKVPPRSFIRQKLTAVGMMVLSALLVIAELVATNVAQFVGTLAPSLPIVGPGVAPALVVASGATSLLAAFALCFAVYYVVPNVRLAASYVLRGAVFASLALMLLSQAFPIYAHYLGGFNRYGAIFGLFFLLMA